MIDPAAAPDLELLRANADAAGQLLKALANPDRLLLLCQLSQGERHVSELEALLEDARRNALTEDSKATEPTQDLSAQKSKGRTP